MSLNKDKLVFEETDIDNSDQVGSHILGTANAKVSSTNVGGKEGLDVNIISTITTQSAAEYAEDSAHASGDVGVHMLAVRQDTLASSVSADGDYASLKVSALGEVYVKDSDVATALVAANASLDAIEASVAQIDIDVSSVITELQSVNTELDTQTGILTTINTSLDAIEVDVAAIEVEAIAINSELDAQTVLLTSIDTSLNNIEAVDFATETTLAGIKAVTDQLTFNAGRLEVVADIRLESDVADDAPDTENPLKMGSRAVDGLLTAISASGDKANVVSDMYRRVYVNDAPNVGFATSAQSVTATAAEIAASPLAGRKRIMIQNLGNRAIFIGFNNTVSISNGLRVAAGAFLEMPFGQDLDIWAVTDSGTQDIRVVQIA